MIEWFLSGRFKLTALAAFLFLAAGHAVAAEAELKLSAGNAQFMLTPQDVRQASSVLASRRSNVILCLSRNKRSEFLRFSQANHGNSAELSVAGLVLGEITLQGVTNGSCIVLGMKFKDDARWIKQVMSGSKKALEQMVIPTPGPDNYCPEKDFIDICLKAFTDMDALKAWADKNGWRWREQESIGESSGGSANLERNGVFSVSETRFSDLSYLLCFYSGPTADPKDRPSICDPAFPLLSGLMPNPGEREKEGGHFSPFRHQWVYAEKNWRISVDTQSNFNGTGAGYFATKIRYRINQ